MISDHDEIHNFSGSEVRMWCNLCVTIDSGKRISTHFYGLYVCEYAYVAHKG